MSNTNKFNVEVSNLETSDMHDNPNVSFSTPPKASIMATTNKFNVQVSNTEAADPCIGVTLSITESATGAIPAGTYNIVGDIDITHESTNDGSIDHQFPVGSANFRIRMQATGSNPVKQSIPFNDSRFIAHGVGKTAYLTVRLVDTTNPSHSYTVLNRHPLSTSRNFSPRSGYNCLND